MGFIGILNAFKINAFLVLLMCCLYSNVNGQNKDLYFKTIPPIVDDTPTWAVLMYGDDPNVYEVYDAYDAYYQDNKFVKTTHTQNYKYWVRQIEAHLNVEGYIRPNKKDKKVKDQPLLKAIGETWESIGPFETYREGVKASWQAYVGCMDMSRSNPNIGYAGSFAIYKTTDKGETWFPITYDLDVRMIERVAVAPSNSNIVYFASSTDLWKSTDGNTFEKILPQVIACNKILIHPTNPDIVMIGSNEGFQRSTDGGLTWTLIKLEKCWDIDFHPTDPTIVYALFNNPTAIKSEFWKSTDTGISFSQQSTGWYNSTDVNRTDGGSRIAVTPANPNRVYVGLCGYAKTGDNNWIGIYRSDDAGASWVNPSGQDGGPYAAANSDAVWNIAAYGGNQGVQQGFYNFDIGVSSTNADKIWVGTVRLAESSNGGQTFRSIGGPESIRHTMHADVQEIVVVGNDIWVASDGGIDYSNDEYQTNVSKKYGINGANYWGFDAGKNLDIMVGGTYHNGNNARHPNYINREFQYIGGSESPTGYVDEADNTRLHCSDIWSCNISTSANVPRTWLFSFLDKYPNEAYVKSQSSEIVYDVNTPTTCYLGKDAIFYKSTNSGTNFTAVFTFNNGNGKVFEIEQSQQNPNKFYAVFHNTSNANSNRGEIYKTTNGGSAWTKVTDIPVANHPYLEISINPNNDEELWVANTSGSFGEKVYRTIDGGNSWSNETTTMTSNINLHDILFIKGTASNAKDRVYLVSDGAVHRKNVIDTDWQEISSGLPVAYSPNQMAYFPSTQMLRIATRGHGIWQLDVSQPCDLIATVEEFVACSTDKRYIGIEIDGTATYDLNWFNPDGSTSNSICNSIIPEGANLTLDGGDQFITNFCGMPGSYYVDIDFTTNCYNTEASFKAIVNTNSNTIEVLEYIHFSDIYPSDMQGDGTNSVTSVSAAYAQIEVWVSGNGLYLDAENMPCGANSFVRIQNGNVHNAKEITDVGTYTANLSGGTGCEGTEAIVIDPPNDLVVSIEDQTVCNAPTYIGVEVDGVAYYDLDWSVDSELNICDPNITQGDDLEVSGGNQLISDFCGNTEGAYYVELAIFTSCYSPTATFKGKIDLTNNIIEVIEYIHFSETTPTTMSGDGTSTVISSSAAFAEYELILDNDQLYLNHTVQPCGSGFVRVNNGFITPYSCPQIIEEGANLILDGGDQFITNFCGIPAIYYVDLEFFTNCYNTEASFKGIVNTNLSTIDVIEYLHFNEATPTDMQGEGTNSVIATSTAYAQIELFVSGDSLYLDAEHMPCGANTVVRIKNGNTHLAHEVTTAGTYDVTVVGDEVCPVMESADISFLVGTACDDVNACTFNDVYDNNCNCIGIFQDSDSDGICDVNDICPNFDDNLIGTSCDDNDVCTINDTYYANCNCIGIFQDSDSDGICDVNDICPNFDDNLIGTSCDDNDVCTTNDTYDNNCNCIGVFQDSDGDGTCDAKEVASFQLKAFLQGALMNSSNANLMRDDLRANNYLPLTEPYSNITYFTHYGTGGGETVASSMLVDKGDSSIVDWLLVELRDKNDASVIVETQSVLLQKDGTIVDVNGDDLLTFSVVNDDYYVAIRHRNHLGIMTLNATNLTPSTMIDFTDINTPTWGVNACVNMNNGTQALWAGNGVTDNQVIFQGTNNDANSIFFTVLQAPTNTNIIPNFIETGYSEGDIDMNGQCIFQGSSNEPNIIFFNILSYPANINFLPNYVITEQLP